MRHWIAVALFAGAVLVQPAAAGGGASDNAPAGTPGSAAGPAAGSAYDFLFRTGTLDALPAGADLVYERRLALPGDPERSAASTGRIALQLDGSTPRTARLVFRRDGGQSGLGAVPAGAGNPIIMYFVESVARDMAELTGGSPFYIRNRLKEALAAPAEATRGAGDAVTVTLRPFLHDPNRDRMKGFGDLVLTVTMRDAAPGWLSAMVAEAPAPAAPDAAAPAYRLELALLPQEGSAP